MTVVTAGIAAHFPQQPQCVFAVVILAGLLQIVMGFLDLGQYIRYGPQSCNLSEHEQIAGHAEGMNALSEHRI